MPRQMMTKNAASLWSLRKPNIGFLVRGEKRLGGSRRLSASHLLQNACLIVVNLLRDELTGHGIERVECRHLDANRVAERLYACELAQVGASDNDFADRAAGN